MDNNSNDYIFSILPFTTLSTDTSFGSTLDFTIFALTLPTPNPVNNSATATYNYTIDPNFPGAAFGGGNTNIVSIQINQAAIDNSSGGLTKSVNLAYAKLGDILNYTINLQNMGNTTATNVIFTDTIPNGTTFVTNSLTLNGVTQPGVTPAPPVGINIGNLGPLATSSITFQVTVATFPSPNPIPNSSTVNYQYVLDPGSLPVSSGGNSNIVTTQVNQAIIDYPNGNGLVKSVSPLFAKLGENLTYTLGVRNTGNAVANNVVLTDTIPTGTSFVNNSVAVNGIPQAGVNPQTGINLGNISIGGVSTVTFQVLVNTVSASSIINNSATVNFQYTLNPSSPPVSASGNSNIVSTGVSQAIIDYLNGGGFVKSATPAFTKVGDIINYTVGLRNVGNVTATNVVFSDTIPTGTSFITNSVSINGISTPGVNPGVGFNLSDIAASNATTITFQVLVNTLPTINPIPNNASVTFQYTVVPGSPPISSGGNSNTAFTPVNQAIIDYPNGNGFTKSSNPAFGTVGNTVTYTLALRNTGNSTALSVQFTDTIPAGTNFVNNSVFINGVSQPGSNPQTGFNVGNIGPGRTTTVTFQVSVLTLPSVNPIPNSATLNYQFSVNPLSPPASGSGNSNIALTTISIAVIDYPNGGGFIKTVNPAYAQVGDVITYGLTMTNTGNITANNVFLIDTIPSATTFVPNSVYVNGINSPGSTPQPPTGLLIGSIGPSSSTTVSFQVVLSTQPTINPMTNSATSNFSYQPDPNGPSIPGGGNSNTVTTSFNSPSIDNSTGGFTKFVNPAYAQAPDIISYTIGMRNTGNVTANNVVLTDTTPTGTTFVTNSLTLNGIIQPGATLTPPLGLTIGNLGPGAASTVTFQVQVVSIPSPNPIPNSGTVNYQYIANPSNPVSVSGGGNSNIVSTRVNQAVIDFPNGGGFIKTADKSVAQVGNTLLYTLGVRNTGSTTATNVVVTDTIPPNTTFVANSVRVNGVVQPGANPAPPAGVNIGTIGALATTTLTFSVTVTSLPSTGVVLNSASTSYQYLVNPLSPPRTGTGNSNIISSSISQPSLTFAKSTNTSNATLGSVIMYTLVVANTGNTPANNVVVIDTVPAGTTFVPNSLILNGAALPGQSPQPPTGVNIGTVGAASSSTLTFDVIVTTIPSINPMINNASLTYQFTVDPTLGPQTGGSNSNPVPTNFNQAVIDGFTKSVDKPYAKVNDLLTYTIGIRNRGTVAATNLVISDTIPDGTTFVTNSVAINGLTQIGVTPNNIVIGTLGPNQATTVTFRVLVTTIPIVNPLSNTANANYQYIVDPSNPNPTPGSGSSNPSTTQVNQAYIDYARGGLTKSVNPAYAGVGQVLTYSILLQNTGNATANNIVFTDTIPNFTTFVPSSVYLNGVNYPGANPQSPGVTVGTLGPGSSSVITFQVTVITITSSSIANSGTVNFQFTVDPSLPPASGSGNSNRITTSVNQAIIDNRVGGGFIKTSDKPYATTGDTITYTLRLGNTGNTTANNVIVIDTIPTYTTFIPDSVVLNGVPQLGASPQPPTGVNVGSIGPGSASTLTFKVVVSTIPTISLVQNNASNSFVFTVDPANPNSQTGGGNSNTYNTVVKTASINLTAALSVNKAVATIPEQLIYTLTLENIGNTDALNVFVLNTLPDETIFVQGSVVINGQSYPIYNPETGFTIPSIPAGSEATVQYTVITTCPTT